MDGALLQNADADSLSRRSPRRGPAQLDRRELVCLPSSFTHLYTSRHQISHAVDPVQHLTIVGSGGRERAPQSRLGSHDHLDQEVSF